jgi:hypothetical protein
VLTRARPTTCVTIRNKLIPHGEDPPAPCPTCRLEEHPLPAVRDLPFNTVTATILNKFHTPIIKHYSSRNRVKTMITSRGKKLKFRGVMSVLVSSKTEVRFSSERPLSSGSMTRKTVRKYKRSLTNRCLHYMPLEGTYESSTRNL